MTNPSHPKTVDPATGEMTTEQAQKSIANSFGIDFLAEVGERDAEAIQRGMLQRVHAGTTMDELFDSLQGKASDSLVGRSFEIQEVSWDIYNAAQGPLPLARVKSIDLATNQPEEWVTTSPMLTVFMKRAQEIGGLPFKAKIVGKKTRSGQTALNFERA